MTKNVYEQAVQKSACAFAYHEAIFDDTNRMTDYRFLDVNQSFEEMTGLRRAAVLGRQFLRDIARDKVHAAQWVDIYREVLAKKTATEFEEYSQEFRRHFLIRAYAIGNNRFVTLFLDTTFEKKMEEIAQYFIDNMGGSLDYDVVTRFAYDVSGACFVAFNLYDEASPDFKTVSICGESADMKKARDLLRFDVIGKNWAHDPEREEKIKGQDITWFEHLWDLTGSILPEPEIRCLCDEMSIGQVAVVKIKKGEKVLGDFTLFFRPEQRLLNFELFRLFLSHLGLFIEKTHLEQALKAGRDRLFSLAESAPVGFITCDINGTITYVNRKLLEIMESPSFEATRQVNLLQFPLLQSSGFTDRLKECMEEDRIVKHEMGYRSKWGRESWLVVHMTPTKNNGHVSGASIVLDDVTETKKIQDDLKEKVYLDSLTLAYNRRVLDTLLQERLEALAAEGKIGCIGVLDVDDFKKINDHYGHKAGDGVLKYLAMRARKTLRDQDLVIRTGGDEFLVYLHDVGSEEGAHHAMERVLKKINGRYRLDDGEGKKLRNLNVTSSMGIAFFPRDGQTVEELMARADGTLYQIKNTVKGVARSSKDPKETIGAISCDEMKKLDAHAIQTVGIPAIVLMEQASLSVFEHIDPDRHRSVVVFCGTGNNGGDGLAVARHCLLADLEVRAFIVGDPEKCSDEFRINHSILHNLGCDPEILQTPEDLDRIGQRLSDADLLVDALLGIGLSREVKDLYGEVIRRINDSGLPVLSVDIPSGLNGDTGQVMGVAVHADKTVTFHRMKKGLLLNPDCAGEVVVERIGIPD